MLVTNATGRVLYCEVCGRRMEPGDQHECPPREAEEEDE